MTNKRVVEKAEINEISCKVRRRRWNWLGHVLRREGVNNCFTALGWTPEGRRARGGQRPLGEGLSKEEEARRSGRDGMWPGQRHATGGLGGPCDGLMYLLAQRAMMMMMMMIHTASDS